MKSPSISQPRVWTAAAVAMVCSLALPQSVQAKDHGHSDHQSSSHRNDNDRRAYLSHSSSNFSLVLGDGYAGRGYYYGPPNYSYYYQRPGVMYYASRALVPRQYYSQSSYSGNSTGASVQRALASKGYYRGYVDGQIGPQSRRAIMNYQQDHGLRVTGEIGSTLLRSLGLY